MKYLVSTQTNKQTQLHFLFYFHTLKMETLSLNRFIFPANLSAPNRTTSFALEIRRAALGISTPTLKTHRPFNHTRKSYVITRASITEQEQSAASEIMQKLQIPLADIDPATAKLAIGILSPFLPAFGFLFVIRIVMSWYPKLPVSEFPYVIAYAPTEPILIPTRKLIPPLGGVDVTPVVWFGLISFLNEILVGPQGLLVLLSQQINN